MTPLYDALSTDYDRFVSWPGRLAYELPFIEQQLERVGARQVLDAACGTGQHAIALAKRGYSVVGADVSARMVEMAAGNARAAGQRIDLFAAGFGEFSTRVGTGFDALLCLGNSLPHAVTPKELRLALLDFAKTLRPGGLLLVQNRNFDAVMAQKNRWMEPQSHRDGQQEWLFVRFYDFDHDGTLTFTVLTMHRKQPDAPWEQRAESTVLRPWLQLELEVAMAQSGFHEVQSFGDMKGAAYLPASDNLVLTGIRV
jgi:SAM-dependent methyltransferase